MNTRGKYWTWALIIGCSPLLLWAVWTYFKYKLIALGYTIDTI